MLNFLKLILLVLFLPLISCSNFIQHTNIIKPKQKKFPTNSFVKIYKSLHVKKCKKDAPPQDCRGGIFMTYGSGISIGKIGNDSLILTAGHVCEVELEPSFLSSVEDYEIKIDSQNTQGLHGRSKVIESIHEREVDLCLLVAKNLHTEGVKISDKKPEVGDTIYSVAAPSGIFHPPAVPILFGIFNGDISPTTSLITMYVTFGASGGGILNEDMELIGVLFATHPAYKNSTLTSTYASTLLFLSHAMGKIDITR